jgi:hypothetical protein
VLSALALPLGPDDAIYLARPSVLRARRGTPSFAAR